MHYLPDTDEEDSAAERFWPEGYKQVIREKVLADVSTKLHENEHFKHIYEECYADKYADHDEFLNRVSDMVAIGAENGADDAFNDIMDSFLYELPLPETRQYAHYLWPETLSEDTARSLKQIVIEEYKVDDVYQNAYNVGYADRYASLDEYIDWVSEVIIARTRNGANDALEKIYRSFILHAPLPPARRHPRRLKAW